MPTQYVSGSATANDTIGSVDPPFTFRDVRIWNTGSNGMLVRVDGGDWITIPGGDEFSHDMYGGKIDYKEAADLSSTTFRYFLSE